MEPGGDVALDIIVSNVVAVFRVRCHLNLRTIALEGLNVIYKPEVGVRSILEIRYGRIYCLARPCVLNERSHNLLLFAVTNHLQAS